MKYGLLFCLATLLLYGCDRDEIQTYQVPKEPASSESMQPPAQQAPAVSTAPVKSAGSGFKAQLPKGWSEVPSSSAMRKVSYGIKGTSIDFYLTPLNTGDMVGNINRWREQVGLASASPEEITNQVVTFQADGHDVKYIEIYNEEGGKGIIAAIVDLKPQYWYFTGKGSVAELKANAGDIRAFLESIKFEGHNH